MKVTQNDIETIMEFCKKSPNVHTIRELSKNSDYSFGTILQVVRKYGTQYGMPKSLAGEIDAHNQRQKEEAIELKRVAFGEKKKAKRNEEKTKLLDAKKRFRFRLSLNLKNEDEEKVWEQKFELINEDAINSERHFIELVNYARYQDIISQRSKSEEGILSALETSEIFKNLKSSAIQKIKGDPRQPRKHSLFVYNKTFSLVRDGLGIQIFSIKDVDGKPVNSAKEIKGSNGYYTFEIDASSKEKGKETKERLYDLYKDGKLYIKLHFKPGWVDKEGKKVPPKVWGDVFENQPPPDDYLDGSWKDSLIIIKPNPEEFTYEALYYKDRKVVNKTRIDKHDFEDIFKRIENFENMKSDELSKLCLECSINKELNLDKERRKLNDRYSERVDNFLSGRINENLERKGFFDCKFIEENRPVALFIAVEFPQPNVEKYSREYNRKQSREMYRGEVKTFLAGKFRRWGRNGKCHFPMDKKGIEMGQLDKGDTDRYFENGLIKDWDGCIELTKHLLRSRNGIEDRKEKKVAKKTKNKDLAKSENKIQKKMDQIKELDDRLELKSIDELTKQKLEKMKSKLERDLETARNNYKVLLEKSKKFEEEERKRLLGLSNP